MAKNRVLTEQQIEEAKRLRKEGLSKSQLAELFGVGKTTIWENIFSTQKRVRLFHKRVYRKKICIPCDKCEICMTQIIKDNYIPQNLQVGNICLSCYMREKGIEFRQLYGE